MEYLLDTMHKAVGAVAAINLVGTLAAVDSPPARSTISAKPTHCRDVMASNSALEATTPDTDRKDHQQLVDDCVGNDDRAGGIQIGQTGRQWIRP